MKISQLYFYPIKSTRGIEVDQLNYGHNGPWALFEGQRLGDREWQFVDEKNIFLSQRQTPKLAQIGVEACKGGLGLRVGETLFPWDFEFQGPLLKVEIWSHLIDAMEGDPFIARTVSDFLGMAVKLVRFPQNRVREAHSKNVGLGAHMRFTDSAPLLLLTDASLRALREKAGEKIPTNRFRANVVLENVSEPWIEHTWKELQAPHLKMLSAKPCARCVVTTLDQFTGEKKGAEPLRSLAILNKQDNKIIFGHYFMAKESGFLKVGEDLKATH
jgi:uncharacterized protein YcbX